MALRFLFLNLPFLIAGALLANEPPDTAPEIELSEPGIQLTVVAEHPAVVTPTGIDVDDAGNIWIVASHTHFRPDDYAGPRHDEVLVLSPQGERSVFYVRTEATMDLELGEDGWVYLAERDRVLRVRDTDGDGVGDQEETLAILDTEGNYPHNGLAGLAWHPDGDLVFSLGENYWEPWTLRGTDGATVHGTGEGGVFRCSPEGDRLRRIARGFWNPFGICVRNDGTIFAAENDPGARPPCRLLHVVEGGDYGYQRLYGSAPFHPFVAWNGELRGTLPMTHSVGEAPCGIAPLGNGLIVPSWTDNRIDFYPLRPAGASFETERVVIAAGSKFFRPTCITQASPTVFYLADWVVGSYEIHGKGRVWKLEIDPAEADWLESLEIAPPTESAQLAEKLRSGGADQSDEQLFTLGRSDDPFLARAAIDALAERVDRFSPEDLSRLAADDRITLLLAIRKAEPKDQAWLRHFWKDSNPDVQFETLRWIADERLIEFLPQVKAGLDGFSGDYQLFEAYLAAWNTLSGNPRAGVADSEMLIQRLGDENASPQTRAFAMRLIDPSHPKLNDGLLDDLLATGDAAVVHEAVRTLASRGTEAARKRLTKIAKDARFDVATRADAISGLANPSPEILPDLLKLASDDQKPIREEALRAIRFAPLDGSQRKELQSLLTRHPDSSDLVEAALRPESLPVQRPEPADTAGWLQRLDGITQPVDREAGRRIFYHSSVGTCSKCHRRNGRGNVVGPDLSAASSQDQNDHSLTALLQPSRDVAPQYYPRAIVTEDGRAFVGILLRDGGGGKEFYRDSTGREQAFKTSEIAMRRELTTSMMPDGLIDTMTDREIRDLLAYLQQPSSSLKP